MKLLTGALVNSGWKRRKAVYALFTMICILSGSLSAQSKKKEVTALLLTGQEITMDGHLHEEIWQEATMATDFMVYEPDFGTRPAQQTRVRFLYSSMGLYIGLEMLDPRPDSIYKDLSVRDDMGNADWVGVILSPSNDGQNGFRFHVTAAGVQYDAKIITDYSDASWDAVWFSKVVINENGWSAEMLIPWSAIRFPNDPEQSWDINIIREVRRLREQSTWSPVDKKRHGFLTQSGKLTGLNNLKTPVRLSLLPYGSGYMQHSGYTRAWSYTFNAGMDVKYGILNNYTLDLTLIPDFGQVRSDDEIYNFSPHEVKYNENRPFFTEGTELFDKAGIFYSRRVGQRPVGFYMVEDSLAIGELILKNPQESQLINATKFSGRGSNGLAIGVFNAMTAPMYATLGDTTTHTERLLETQPFTNYNMLVLDQSLPNNSYIHVANTHLSRKEYNANVFATIFQLKNRKQRLAVSGTGMVSKRFGTVHDNDPGYQYSLVASKISGHIRWKTYFSATSAEYNPNDMGYLARNNVANFYGEVGYYQFTPIRNMLYYNLVASGSYNMRNEAFQFTWAQINLRAVTTYRNRLSLGSSMEIVPTKYHDHFEARTPGRVFVQPGFTFLRIWSSPDYRKRFLVDLNAAAWQSHHDPQKGFSLSVSPRVRLNSRAIIIVNMNLDREWPQRGYVSKLNINDTSLLIFGDRNVNNLTTALTGDYVISPVSSMFIRFRHYWVTSDYQKFYLLNQSGHVEPFEYNEDKDFTVNILTVDLGYSWNFAPGSYLNIVYKNYLSGFRGGEIHHHYLRNWGEMMESPALNSLSVKLMYYLDYEMTKNRIKRKGHDKN